MGKIAEDCNLDVERGERARALHRVVRAMHDGHCPSCGHLAPSDHFYRPGGLDPSLSLYDENNVPIETKHVCPNCQFTVTESEASQALAEFRPYLNKSVDVFLEWRKSL